MMDSNHTPTGGFNKQEPIPGYVTKELLGAGGYGEVWKCLAPGGLFKAVKFIYADANSKRATTELRSLNRIKEVRHPFLLSIERIEVIDENVVIITELADQSLKRQFQKQRAKGLPGLPREELLGYLRDTADALDYIYENYSLQHLDIKPENLLLVGDRAKVADFGLIKNLYDRVSFSIEGLTPTYAPPELFEGKPNRNSDQYSLAVVYVEMLTGDLPFEGTTPAQFAAQHLHMAPTLSGLPANDQPIVARALSKDPAQRFANCRALVEALAKAGQAKSASNGGPVRPRARAPQPVANVPCSTQELDEMEFGVLELAEAITGEVKRTLRLPPVEMDDAAADEYEPVLFLGIGGTATRVLRRLRRRIYDRIGAMELIPSVEMMLVDTDVRSLNRATDGEFGSALDGNERVPMPLRRSEDYRSTAGSILTSISRRWLFNVPYNLETNGFRPLGRLALIDHSKRLLERLQQTLTNITSESSIAASEAATGMKFVSRQPRVFIVASTAGGTGSGMVLDVAYAVRTILSKLDLPDGNVHGILLHSTPCGQRDRDKAVANSYAALTELWHYSRPGKCYPGDRGCGLPPFHGNNRTFSSCYFVHLGDELTELQFDVATDPVAEYLYASSLTAATQFFDKCRQMEYVRWGTELTEPVLRTFGLCQLGGSNSEVPTIVAELLCRDLTHRWRGGSPGDDGRTAKLSSVTAVLTVSEQESQSGRFSKFDSAAESKADELGVEPEAMRNAARKVLDQQLSPDAVTYFDNLIASRQDSAENGGNEQIIGAIDSTLTPDEGAELNSISAVLNTRLEGKAAKLASSVCDWIFDLVDSPGGVTAAKHAAEWFKNHLRELHEEMLATTGRLREQALSRHHAILRGYDEERPGIGRIWARKKLRQEAEQLMRDYAATQIEQAVACAVIRWLRLVEAQVNAELTRLQVLWKDLGALAEKFHVSQSLDEAFECQADSDIVPSNWLGLLRELVSRRNELMDELDREIEKKLDVGPKKLRWFVNEARPIDIELAAPMRAVARQLILNAMQALNASRLCADEGEQEESPQYRQCIESARPALAEQAGGIRLLVMVPNDVAVASVRQSADECQLRATIVPSTDGDLIACQEGELLEVRCVGAQLIGGRREFVEISQRLHTRIDVNWDDMSSYSPNRPFNIAACDVRQGEAALSEVRK